MGLYADLTVEEKDRIQATDGHLRAWLAGVHRSVSHAQIIRDELDAGVAALVASLDAGEIIPDSTNLRDAVALTRAEWVTMNNALNAYLTEHDVAAERQLAVKAAGASNLLKDA